MTFELWLTLGGIASVFGCVSAFDKYDDMDDTTTRATVIMFLGTLLGPLSIPVAFVMAYRRYCGYLEEQERKQAQFEQERQERRERKTALPYKTDGEAP